MAVQCLTVALDIAPRKRHLGRSLLPLGLVFLSVGTSAAVVGPFLSLFLSTAVRANPLQVTLFLVASPLAGVVASTMISGLSDRRPIRRKLLIAASLAGLTSMALTAVVRDYWILLGLAMTVNALAGVLYPQTFAYARQILRDESPSRAALGISSMRTVFSAAWVAGPPLSALLLDAGGFALVYGVASTMYGVAALVGIFLLKEVGAPITAVPLVDGTPDTGPVVGASDPPEVRGRTLLLSAVAFTLLQCPLTLAVQSLPLFITTELHGEIRDAGTILGLCAALEIPLMLVLGVLTARFRLRVLLLVGTACGVAYYLAVALASAVWVLLATQVINAFFIAAVTGLGISYMQELLPLQPGKATTMFTNSFPIGAMLAGPLLGLAQHFGYRLSYAMGAVLSLAGLLILLATRPPRAVPAHGGGVDRAPYAEQPA